MTQSERDLRQEIILKDMRIAALEKRLEEAERVIEPFAKIVTEGIAKRNDTYTSITTCTDYFRAARAFTTESKP